MEKELLFEGTEKTMAINLKEFSAEGVKQDFMASGKISGKITGMIVTTHNVLMKPDGTGSADVRSIIFSNGESIMVMGKAKGKIVDPTPMQTVEEDLTFMTPSKNLAYLNTTKGYGDGTINIATGEYTFKVYAVK